MENDFPCICGHAKIYHYANGVNGPETIICGGCLVVRGKDLFIHHFKLDNLKYLESKYKELQHE